jgi:hypothetical protein
MTSYAVKHVDGAFCAVIDGNVPAPIRVNGIPVKEFHPGWSPERLCRGPGSTNYLPLTHVSGQHAVWYLDQQLNRLCDRFSDLPETERAFAGSSWQRTAEAIWRGLICEVQPTLPDETAGLIEGTRYAREDLIRCEIIRSPPPARAIVLSELATGNTHIGAGHDRIIQLSISHLRNVFRADFLQCQIEAIRRGRLELPSPIDGRPMPSMGSLKLTDMSYAYRFCDLDHGIPFYAVASDWRFGIWAILFPTLDIVIYERPDQKGLVEASFLGTAPNIALLNHAFIYADSLYDYVRKPELKPIICYSYYHLGHHLWNELTGIHAVLQQIPPDALPPIFVAQPQQTEMYGKLDRLFPQLAGRIDRTVGPVEKLADLLYRGGYLHLRPTGSLVSRDLAGRIMDFAERQPGLTVHKRQYDGLKATSYRIVTLGLRVENRTVVDLPRFCIELISLLRRELGRVAVIVDGHNSADADSGAYKSHEQHLATRQPIDVEREIVSLLERHFAADPAVVIIPTVGHSIGISVFWCRRSEFFVTPWGAGLAKYRWVCNLPGLVVTNRYLLLHPSDEIHLYDSPRYIEAPAPIWFIGPETVEDMPDAELVIPDPRGRANFRVDMAAVRENLREIIRMNNGIALPQELFASKFAADGDGHLYQRFGWSTPEPHHVWALGAESRISVPTPRPPTDCTLELDVVGLMLPPLIDCQTLQIDINGIDAGTFLVGPPRTIRCRVPWYSMQMSSTLEITFRHQRCARPSDYGGVDQRCLAVRFSAVRLRPIA